MAAILHRCDSVRKEWMIGRLIFLFAVSVFAFASADVSAQERTDCVNALGRAQDMYNNAQFDESLNLLQSCLTKGAFPSDEQQVDVYLLMGRANHSAGRIDEAKVSLANMLSLSPSYQPDTGRLPPSFVQLVEEVRSEMSQRTPEVVKPPRKKGGALKYVLIGIGVVAAGVAAAILLKPKDETPEIIPDLTLPGPPDLPVKG